MDKIKILYVEDELFLGKIVKESLESRGFDVCMVSDGADVLPAFERSRPDVCVLDIMLPNMDGFGIAGKIRELDEQVPILFLTARTRTDDVVKGFALGGNDYIRKPFSMEELIVRVQHCLNIRNRTRDRSLVESDDVAIGKYRFRWRRQILDLEGETRRLSFRENELLKYLFERRNEVIDRKDILNLLWGNDSFFNSRNLDVYIAKLRGYLKADGSVGIITLKGIGYRFVAG